MVSPVTAGLCVASALWQWLLTEMLFSSVTLFLVSFMGDDQARGHTSCDGCSVNLSPSFLFAAAVATSPGAWQIAGVELVSLVCMPDGS